MNRPLFWPWMPRILRVSPDGLRILSALAVCKRLRLARLMSKARLAVSLNLVSTPWRFRYDRRCVYCRSRLVLPLTFLISRGCPCGFFANSARKTPRPALLRLVGGDGSRRRNCAASYWFGLVASRNDCAGGLKSTSGSKPAGPGFTIKRRWRSGFHHVWFNFSVNALGQP